MPMVYGQYGPGLPGNPALDGLRQLGSLNSAGSGSTGSINPNRLTESDSWSYPPPQTPPDEVSGAEHILDSLRMAYGIPKNSGQTGFGTGAVPARSEKPSPVVLHG